MNILLHPDPMLRQVSTVIKTVDAEFKHRVKRMFRLMHGSKGVGLAAIQVGWPVRMFIAKDVVFINPVLSNMSQRTETEEEGCLSLPGRFGMVKRSYRVHMSAWGLNGKEIRTEMEGTIARIVQHEMDHLNGILFFDREEK